VTRIVVAYSCVFGIVHCVVVWYLSVYGYSRVAGYGYLGCLVIDTLEWPRSRKHCYGKKASLGEKESFGLGELDVGCSR
jgi:hypothetical protein